VIGLLVKASPCVAKRARAMFPSVQAAIDEFDALDMIVQPWQAWRSQPAPGAAAAAGATGAPGTSAEGGGRDGGLRPPPPPPPAPRRCTCFSSRVECACRAGWQRHLPCKRTTCTRARLWRMDGPTNQPARVVRTMTTALTCSPSLAVPHSCSPALACRVFHIIQANFHLHANFQVHGSW